MKQSLYIGLAIFALAACSPPEKDNSSQSSQADQTKVAKPADATSTTLDIIVGGPFAIVENVSCQNGSGSCLALWAPNAHSQMTGLSAPAQVKGIDAGDYDFEKGVHGSKITTVVVPVQNSSIYQVPPSMQHATAGPISKPFATIVLPMPREIVSWNADPMQIVGNGSPTPSTGVTSKLATLVVLRYDFQTGDTPVMTNSDGDFWKAAPITSGSEKFIVIGYTNGNVTGTMNPHKHAVSAFNALAKMLGVKWKLQISDPPSSFTRNRPFDPDPPSLPQDLLNVIDQIPIQTQAKASLTMAPVPAFLGKINDCKAPAILVTK